MEAWKPGPALAPRTTWQGSEVYRYAALAEDEEGRISTKNPSVSITSRSNWANGSFALLLISNLMLFGFSLSNFYRTTDCDSTLSGFGGHRKKHSMNDDLKRTSTYSPLLDMIDMSPKELIFNGKLSDNTSIYRMPPSPEVDEAWNYISTEGLEVITVPSYAIEKSGKDPNLSVKAPSSWHQGSDAFLVQIDVFHQIHCLNELRKELYYDQYYSAPPDTLQRDHKNHCVHMLLQNIMCHADVEIISHNWVHNDHIPDPKERPFPDFNVVKQCRDFDRLLDGARDNGIRQLAKKWNALRIPLGAKTVAGDGYA
ncbi:tat pathway signal sequence protein [Rutstroemia sp. NJR-2017a BBW]|nr:tat pathway signal sequence protein [Rutstroemia sp. NJR-2017a BBW]